MASTGAALTKIGGMDVDATRLAELLDCPACSMVPEPPILLCVEGHSICQKCRSKLETCPLCDSAFSKARNLLAEELVLCLSRKCPNAKEGCDVILPRNLWDSHALECPFRQVVCDLMQRKPCFNNVKMNYKKYFNHLKNVHGVDGVEATIINVTQFVTQEQSGLVNDIPRGMWPTQYLKACNEIFLTGTALIGGKIFWWLSVIGDESVAAKYIAKVSLTVKSKLYEQSWTGPVHSFRTTPDMILTKGFCLLATTETLNPFIYKKNQQKPPPIINVPDSDSGNEQEQVNVGWNVSFSVMKIEKLMPKVVQPKPKSRTSSTSSTSTSTSVLIHTKKTGTVKITNGASTNDLNLLGQLRL